MGGAIANYDGNSVIDRIAGNFIGNYIESTYGNFHGGALLTVTEIKSVLLKL